MSILQKPVITEKMTIQGEKLNRYGFIVNKSVNKLQIKEAVENMYGVTVDSVNTMRYAGKSRSRFTKAGAIKGKTNAYIHGAYKSEHREKKMTVNYLAFPENKKRNAKKREDNLSLKKDVKVILTNSSEAESIKLFSNTYLAMRVSFFNELDTFCYLNNLREERARVALFSRGMRWRCRRRRLLRIGFHNVRTRCHRR